MSKKALMTASVASMIDLFNMDNIQLLQQLGYEVHVACNFEFGSITSQERVNEFREELEKNGIKTIHVPIPRKIGNIGSILESYRLLRRLCEQEEYALIHTQSPIGGVAARLAARKMRKKGTKVIYTAHGFHFYKGAPKKNWLVFYPIEKFFSRITDVLITINGEDYEMAKTFHAGRVYYVPGIGLDIKKFSRCDADAKTLRKSMGFEENDFIVLSVGQLSKRKNQQTIIRAIAQIKDRHVKYLIAGLGELEEEDHRLAEQLGIADRIVFVGYCSDISELYHMADCFAFPSLQEGLPVSLMEAMAAGLPVVCSRIRGNTDLIEHGVQGELLEPMDIEGYANAIVEIKENQEKADLYRKNAFEQVQHFRRECVEEKMREIYEQIF